MFDMVEIPVPTIEYIYPLAAIAWVQPGKSVMVTTKAGME